MNRPYVRSSDYLSNLHTEYIISNLVILDIRTRGDMIRVKNELSRGNVLIVVSREKGRGCETGVTKVSGTVHM